MPAVHVIVRHATCMSHTVLMNVWCCAVGTHVATLQLSFPKQMQCLMCWVLQGEAAGSFEAQAMPDQAQDAAGEGPPPLCACIFHEPCVQVQALRCRIDLLPELLDLKVAAGALGQRVQQESAWSLMGFCETTCSCTDLGPTMPSLNFSGVAAFWQRAGRGPALTSSKKKLSWCSLFLLWKTR